MEDKNRKSSETCLVIPVTRYECGICKRDYETSEAARKCYDSGIDHITIPRGLVLGFKKFTETPWTEYIVLHELITRPHYSQFIWVYIQSHFQFGSCPAFFTPNWSGELREFFTRTNHITNVTPLTDAEFQKFLEGASKVRYERCGDKNCDLTKEYALVHKHPELSRILHETF